MSGIFTHAYEDEILTANPALKLGKFIPKQDRRAHVRPLTREQVRAFLACVREHFPQYYAFMLTAFRTGLRLGELLGLAWDDVDFEANQLTVRKSYTHGHFTTPKSHKSRVVDMSDQLHTALASHHETLLAAFGGRWPVTPVGGRCGVATMVQLVFPNRAGQPMCADNFRKRGFYKMIESADVPHFRFHDIRHYERRLKSAAPGGLPVVG